MPQKEYAIIVAGGKGTRMHSSTPKQFMLLDDLPVLAHSINAFLAYNPNTVIILVLPEDDIDHWKQWSENHGYAPRPIITKGGASRFQSVKNGLQAIQEMSGLVAIHDGVRPLVDADTIGASFRIAAVHRSAVAAVRLKESLRMTDQDTTKAVDRALFRLIQTPQTFDLELIRKAYTIPETSNLTDDASVAEQAGFKISLFEGSYENLKITTPEDLVIARALLSERKKKS
jgi:2-C-methyl-D-erythritol 4-phosphate cytidylyltransferase